MSTWTEAAIGARLTLTPTNGWAFDGTPVELALRRNPKRAQLLVSRLLGKHIPVPVGDVLAAGTALGRLVHAACAGESPVVIGFAETATALGHAVAAGCGYGSTGGYLHTTRRAQPGHAFVLRFLEEHSHAVDQALVISAVTPPDADVPLVLVDDELTTGTSALNAIRVLQQTWPRHTYVLASLVDSRSEAQRAAIVRAVHELGAEVTSVALYDAELSLPDDVLLRASAAYATTADGAAETGHAEPVPTASHSPVPTSQIELRLAATTSANGMWGDTAEVAAKHAAAECVARLDVTRDNRTLVLGDEEFMYIPQMVAAALGPDVCVSATTRSPAVVVDNPGYPLRTVLSFASTTSPQRQAYAYNVAPANAAADRGTAPGFDNIVFVTDSPLDAHVHSGVLAQLARSARVGLTVVTVPMC